MTWELISLKAHPHRAGADDAMVVIRKAMRRGEGKGANTVLYQVDVCPFPLLVKQADGKQLVPLEQAHFRVTADLENARLRFDIGNADAALPSVLRGGGLGSLAISELIIWAKKYYPEFAVTQGYISAAMLNYPNAEQNVVKCLKNFGFLVARAPSGGLLFEAASPAQLKHHMNTAKIDHANPIQWGSALVQDNVRLAAQLLEQSQTIAGLKEQLHQVTQVKQSPVPFLGGILAGCVAGTAIAAFLFSI